MRGASCSVRLLYPSEENNPNGPSRRTEADPRKPFAYPRSPSLEESRMKRSILAVALALVAFALPAVAQELSGNVYSDPATPISVGKGHDFLVALASNPTTGYSWTASVSNANIENDGSAYQA